MLLTDVREQLERATRRILSDQNRDVHAPAYGCMDRRYWAWKLVDFPEATFQRNVLVLAWSRRTAEGVERAVLSEAIEAGLSYAVSIQHPDGSWDQAFPHEHSFGATAFLLHPLLTAYSAIREECSPATRQLVEPGLRRAADFLCAHDEAHGHIANHLAGAVLSLMLAGRFFEEARYGRRADEILAAILGRRSTEGWFVEYDGADPGYQTLCLYYLVQVQQLRPTATLRDALDAAVAFLAWFVHPDGTFGGEYGSRRTAVFYPGGLALLAAAGNVTAAAMLRAMLESVRVGRTIRLDQIDAGNLAPLAANYLLLLEAGADMSSSGLLPWQDAAASADFPEAGLYVRSSPRRYTVVGASNGGVVKVFDRAERTLLYNDGGYVGQDGTGRYVTTQHTDTSAACAADVDSVAMHAPFYRMGRALPTPVKLLPLRVLNVTAMRHVGIGNAVKRGLVRLLIRGGIGAPVALRRTVRTGGDRVVIEDELRLSRGAPLRWLECGRPFVAIHMASARYYEHAAAAAAAWPPRRVDVQRLGRDGVVRQEITV